MKKKTEVLLKAIGIFLGVNVLMIVTALIGRWLEIKHTKPSPPGAIFAMQIFPLMLAILYYRNKTKRD